MYAERQDWSARRALAAEPKPSKLRNADSPSCRQRNAKIFRRCVSFFCWRFDGGRFDAPSSKDRSSLVDFALIAIGTKWALNVADYDFVKFDQRLVLFVRKLLAKLSKQSQKRSEKAHGYFLKVFLFGVLLRVILQAEGVL